MVKNTGPIGGVAVAGLRYVVYGRAVGLVSTHENLDLALRSLAVRGPRACRLARGPRTAAAVYRWGGAGWVPVTPGRRWKVRKSVPAGPVVDPHPPARPLGKRK